MKRCPHGRWQRWDASLKESKHHIQMWLTEEFEVGRRQMTVEIWLNPPVKAYMQHTSHQLTCHSISQSTPLPPRDFGFWSASALFLGSSPDGIRSVWRVTQRLSTALPSTFPMGIKEYERASILVLCRTMYIHKHVLTWSKIFWKSSMYPRLSREGI